MFMLVQLLWVLFFVFIELYERKRLKIEKDREKKLKNMSNCPENYLSLNENYNKVQSP
jgi:hypothetical protein